MALLASVSESFSVVSCQFLSWTTDGWTGAAHTTNTLTFLFHLHVRAATEYMRPKVILQAHHGLQSIAATSGRVWKVQRRGREGWSVTENCKDYSARENGEGGASLPKLQRGGSKDYSVRKIGGGGLYTSN